MSVCEHMYDARPPTISIDCLGICRSRRPFINIGPNDEQGIAELEGLGGIGEGPDAAVIGERLDVV